jgi:Tfp pilus assembly protein PilF/peroxiredoxin
MFHCELVRVPVRIFAVICLLVSSQCYGQLRKVAVGDKMPEFSLPDANGVDFSYKYDKQKVLAVLFVSQKQQNSARALVTAKRVVSQLHSEGASGFELVAVTTEEPNATFVESCMEENKWLVRLLIDSKYQLWGKLGVIAMPTVVVCDKDDVVFWVKAGYGHDFEQGLRAYLQEALGLIGKGEASKSIEVKTLKNTGTGARLARHIRMAKILEGKGRNKSAIRELRKGITLDPNSAQVAVELGRLLCKTDQGQAAVDLVSNVKVSNRVEQARLLELSGWARRQMGQLERAEKELLEATKLDPRAARAFFELGKLYRGQGKTDKAVEAYHEALRLLFDEPREVDPAKK